MLNEVYEYFWKSFSSKRHSAIERPNVEDLNLLYINTYLFIYSCKGSGQHTWPGHHRAIHLKLKWGRWHEANCPSMFMHPWCYVSVITVQVMVVCKKKKKKKLTNSWLIHSGIFLFLVISLTCPIEISSFHCEIVMTACQQCGLVKLNWIDKQNNHIII